VAIRYLAGGPEKADAGQPQQTTAKNYPIRQTSATAPSKIAAAATAPTSKTAATTARQSANPAGAPANGSPKAAGKAMAKLADSTVAEVNNRKISREELAQNCLDHYGEEVMEMMRNKYLIMAECQQNNISVTPAEVNAEIERMASSFNLPVDQWMKMLKQDRGINPDQYAEEIIWPTLALRKLAVSTMQVSSEEIRKEFETMYGKQIRARLISVKTLKKAQEIREDAAAHADDVEYFGRLAKDHSIDGPSAAIKGVIQPILRHGADKVIEKAAFSMKDGEVSQVLEVPVDKSIQYVILRKDGEIAPRKAKLDELLSKKLEEIVRARKLTNAAAEKFKELQKSAEIKDVWNDPEEHQKMPDVAVLINGRPIPMADFVNTCLDRHGEEVLETMIGRKLIEIEIEKKKIAVTDADLQEELERAALHAVLPKADGSPDVEAFKKLIMQEQRVKFAVYIRDGIWPAVALRKLAEPNVDVTAEDLRKGFEANYGPRVRCLAIVLNNQRRANEVWEKARKKNTTDNFGDLAAEYSIEPGSQALRGEVPPIKKNGGQPYMEEEAFKLSPGELSGVIQVDDKFVILRCEGLTGSSKAKFEEVKDLIHQDLYEKKLRIAMAECYENLMKGSAIDNYLTGLSRAPYKVPLNDSEHASAASSNKVPSSYQKLRTK
jgi:parvulin-like peptidyl-prolyl isomerase